ncbi:MAG: NAD(P)-dependent oxidoreductase [Betaproteobacteria bacterium]|nr:NAD(P)-dependent oxidoreductase [Betaproteobacteria bacterium]
MSEPFTPPERIGFVGLGQMGYPMARNLARAGFRLAVADTNTATVRRFADEVDCDVSADLCALGAACRAVITMLPDGKIVRDVVQGDSGASIADGLRVGSMLIDMSSSSPLGTRDLGEALRQRGIECIDAPVSGGVKKALDGSLSIMAGGAAAAIDRARAILEVMGAQIFETGPLGSGHAMKALNNYVSAAGLAAAIEAVLAGSQFGLDPEVVVHVLNTSTGRNNSTENKFSQLILSRAFNGGFSLALMVKDLRTAMEVAAACGSPVPLGEACLDLWARAEQELGGQVDHTAVAQYWERLAGSELHAGGGARK